MVESLTLSLKNALPPLDAVGVVYIAYSGGLDSQVLLHLALELRREVPIELQALHLNHGLSDHAQAWQSRCAAQCAQYAIPLRCHEVMLDRSAGNIEQRAREARYSWFEELLKPGDVLLTAHHRDDQAETMVLRLLRGSGVRGLSGIPRERELGRGRIVRPLLDHDKAELQDYAEHHGLTWIEDESNYSIAFDRNYIRHQVLPALVQRWPQAVRQLALSSRNCSEDQGLLDALADMDIERMSGGEAPLLLERAPPLQLSGFRGLSKARQRNVLNRVLRPMLSYPVPLEQMNEWLRQIGQATPESRPRLLLTQVMLAVHDGRIHFTCPPDPRWSAYSRKWRTDTPLSVLNGAFSLRLVERRLAAHGDVEGLGFQPGDEVCVCSRRGGERVQLPGEAFSRSLKKLYQEKRIAPWLRDNMPLITLEGHLVWSALLGDCAPFLLDSEGKCYGFELYRNE